MTKHKTKLLFICTGNCDQTEREDLSPSVGSFGVLQAGLEVNVDEFAAPPLR